MKPQRFHEAAVEYPLRPAAIRGRSRQDAGVSKVCSILVSSVHPCAPPRPLKIWSPLAFDKQVGGKSVVNSENASRGGGPSLSAVWRPARDPGSTIVTSSGSKASIPPLLDGPDDTIDVDGALPGLFNPPSAVGPWSIGVRPIH